MLRTSNVRQRFYIRNIFALFIPKLNIRNINKEFCVPQMNCTEYLFPHFMLFC